MQTMHAWEHKMCDSVKAPSHQASASTDGYVPQHFRRHAMPMLSVHKPITFTHGWHWRHYAGPTLRWCWRLVWMGLYKCRVAPMLARCCFTVPSNRNPQGSRGVTSVPRLQHHKRAIFFFALLLVLTVVPLKKKKKKERRFPWQILHASGVRRAVKRKKKSQLQLRKHSVSNERKFDPLIRIDKRHECKNHLSKIIIQCLLSLFSQKSQMQAHHAKKKINKIIIK